MIERPFALRSYIQGPRWAGLREFLFQASVATEVRLTVTEHSKGLLRETIYFTAEGHKPALQRFIDGIRSSVQEYNG